MIYCNDTKESFIHYRDYLKSHHWISFRAQYYLHHDRKCKCGAKSSDLHHLTYKTLGKEVFSDVVTLCRFCHDKEHGIESVKLITTPKMARPIFYHEPKKDMEKEIEKVCQIISNPKKKIFFKAKKVKALYFDVLDAAIEKAMNSGYANTDKVMKIFTSLLKSKGITTKLGRYREFTRTKMIAFHRSLQAQKKLAAEQGKLN